MNTKPSFHYVISFPDFKPSEAVKVEIESYLQKLEKIFDRIISCSVAVRAPNISKKKHDYHINLHLEIPGEDIIINHQPEADITHSNIHLAIRDAFRVLHRKLQKRKEMMREK